MGKDKLSDKELEELKLEIEKMVFIAEKDAQTPAKVLADAQNTQDVQLTDSGSYVKIAQDGMSAWLYLAAPNETREYYDKPEIMEFIQSKGVTTGFHNSNIVAMIDKKIYEREILVAAGKTVVDGKDGYYEYAFAPEYNKAPRIREDGSVDYTSMKALQNVRAGDVVATYHHAVRGEDGYTVQGKPLKAKTVKEAPPLRGQSISNSENPDVYVATKDGKIEVKDGRIDIQSIHEIQGDVDLTIGKIEFYGDVVIHGNVETGVIIRAGRNIKITGTVEGATLFAGGDIILTHGINGGQRAKVSARGSIFADFIEYTVVAAGCNVQANSIMNSRVAAEGKVMLTGARGILIGGYTHGLQGIEAMTIGNDSEVRTVVHIGCEAEKYYKNLDLKKKEKLVRKQLADMRQELESLIRQRRLSGDKLTPIMEDKYQQMISAKEEAFQTLEDINQDKQMIAAMMERGKDAMIIVRGNIYRGSVIGIVQLQMPIENTTCFMKYYMQSGMICGNVVQYS